ncbi:hypothetical protein GCK72_017149 [Caenorhabditis remanei]|uniref:Transmembrane protein n=1 Tax=Caenorhabditis remanei TaxID=31234 RepID=A0A6A5G6C0_CAERE|nr:hypothetical protein GCK72_017149 [Caenorhabditis remanei]KAF1750598.1 hypothetical protein GCK72_017149 [Caenorhabditis remanei]
MKLPTTPHSVSLSDLSSDDSETEKSLNLEELTPREKEIKKLEESSDENIKEWKEHKKEVGKMTVDFWGVVSFEPMHDHQRLAADDLKTEKPLNSEELTPKEKEIKKLEESRDGYIKEWKEQKKEIGKLTVEFWEFKAYLTFCMLLICYIATKEVSLCITMSQRLLASLLVGEIVIFLFPIIYFMIRRKREKKEINAKNEDIEREGEIGKVIFDSEKTGNEEYLELYKDQLEKFNAAKLKEVSILEEEVQQMKDRNITWKQCVAMWTLFTCFMATVEVYQCIEIRGMDEALRNSAFVVETIIFLFPIGYLYIRERQEKSKMKENNKDIENADEIKEVPFNLEEAENEEYLEFYKDQLKKFNSVKLKEVSILEEEIRLIDNRGFRWNITAMGIFVLSVWIVFIHSVLIYLHSPPCAKVKVDPLPGFYLTFAFTLDLFFKICIRRCGYHRNRIVHNLEKF